MFKALADDTRLQLVLLIMAEQEMCVCEMTHALNQSQPKISRHLALLRQHELLSDRREGQWVYYRLSPSLKAGALAVLQDTFRHYQHHIRPARDRLTTMGHRPERRRLCC
nr:metalloregulator ArsR/SmtB family transcription factor [Oceanisphaera litoralis]